MFLPNGLSRPLAQHIRPGARNMHAPERQATRHPAGFSVSGTIIFAIMIAPGAVMITAVSK